MEIIHIVLGKANPDRLNGVNKVVYQLATNQALSGRNVTLWGITPNPIKNYGDRAFKTTLFKACRNPFNIDSKLKKALVERKGGAVFHLHGGWIPVFYSISLLLVKNNIPFVFTPHGAYNIIAMKKSERYKKIYFKLFERKLLAGAKKIHSLGESEVEGLHYIYPNNKSFLLPYGFDSLDVKYRHTPNKDKFVVGYMGRIDIHTKGLDWLIEAFSIFEKRVTASELWILGDGGESEKFDEMVKDAQIKNIVRWGNVFDDERFRILSQMDVFVLLSRNEGLPSALIEAASVALPLVVSRATNFAPYITEANAGVAIDKVDVNKVVEALFKVKDINTQNNLMGNNGKKMVEELFSWSNLIERFDLLYE